MRITFCIPSKNNLRYLKTCVSSIKANSFMEHEVIVFVDSDNDGTVEWLTNNNIKYLVNDKEEPKGIAHGYNVCIENATSNIVCMFHADMYMAKGFDAAIIKHLKKGTVVAGTRIEPPLHPEGKEKVVKNFGMYPEDFEQEKFDMYVNELIDKNLNHTTKGIFAPWACYKEDIVSIDLHDEYFHSYHEDSDIFNRFILAGYDIVQTWEGYVYHLTCRGGQFQDGVDKITTDPAFHAMKSRSMRHYLRKWGSWIKNDQYQHPIISHKYDIGFVIKNCNPQILDVLEPWCSTIYVDCDYKTYIEKEQSNTLYDLWERIKPYDNEKQNHILVSFDATKLTHESFQIIQQLPDIITQSGQIGEFELDIFNISILDMTTFENNLIQCSTIS